MNTEHPRYFALSTYFYQRFGQRVQKIPLDAGFSCPNRDGVLSSHGCVFCNAAGSGSGQGMEGMSLAEQYLWWRDLFYKKYKAKRFLAYLQSFTNTYGPLKKLTAVLDQLRELPELHGLCIGTRPDCIDPDKLSALADFPGRETWLDLGLQSSNDSTLEKINRGHTAATFSKATIMAADRGIKVCAHVIAGLPGENEETFLQTIRFLNNLPIRGIKIHNLYVCKGSTLAGWWAKKQFTPMSEDAYVDTVVRALEILRPDIVIHRLNGDPQPQELLAPSWAANKGQLILAIQRRLHEENNWQGRETGTAPEHPAWYARAYRGPFPLVKKSL